jgi:hypothetical protein
MSAYIEQLKMWKPNLLANGNFKDNIIIDGNNNNTPKNLPYRVENIDYGTVFPVIGKYMLYHYKPAGGPIDPYIAVPLKSKIGL